MNIFGKLFIGNNNVKKSSLFIFLLLVALLWYILFEPRYTGDDGNFIFYARQFADHGLHLNVSSHFGLRWMAYIPAGLLYRLFGVNDFTTTIPCFLATILLGYLVHYEAKRNEVKTYLLILIMYFLSYSVLFYSKRLIGDPLLSLWIFLSLICYYKYQIYSSPKLKFYLPVFSSVSFFLAFLSKETVILILPLYAYLFIKDLSRRKAVFWQIFIGTSAFLFAGYLVLFKLTTNDWFYRFTVLYQNSYLTGCSFDVLPFSFTLKRISYGLLSEFIINGDLIIYGPALLYGIIYRTKIRNNSFNLFTYRCFVILFLSSIFMTVSYKAYVPLCPDPRHFLFLMPFAAICAGNMFVNFIEQPHQNKFLFILFGMLTVVAFAARLGETKYLYALMFLFTLLYYFTHRLFNYKWIPYAGILGVFMILLIHPIYDIVRELF